MEIRWRRLALADLAALRAFIAGDNPEAARAVALRVRAAVDRLATYPHLGRPGRVTGTRELVVAGTPYVVPYRIESRRVDVLRVYHGARFWPDRPG